MAPLSPILHLYRNILEPPKWTGFNIDADTDISYNRGRYLTVDAAGACHFHAYASLSDFNDIDRRLPLLDIHSVDNHLVSFTLSETDGALMRRFDTELEKKFRKLAGCRGLGMSTRDIITIVYSRTVLDFTSSWMLSPSKNGSRHSDNRQAVLPPAMRDILRHMLMNWFWAASAINGPITVVNIHPSNVALSTNTMLTSSSLSVDQDSSSDSDSVAFLHRPTMKRARINISGSSASVPIVLSDDEPVGGGKRKNIKTSSAPYKAPAKLATIKAKGKKRANVVAK